MLVPLVFVFELSCSNQSGLCEVWLPPRFSWSLHGDVPLFIPLVSPVEQCHPWWLTQASYKLPTQLLSCSSSFSIAQEGKEMEKSSWAEEKTRTSHPDSHWNCGSSMGISLQRPCCDTHLCCGPVTSATNTVHEA